jgi:hypothetical protein
MAKKLILATDTISEKDAIAQLNSKRSGDNTTATATIATDTVESSSPEQPPQFTGELRLTADQLNAAIQTAVDAALAPVRSELQTAQDSLTEVRQQKDSLEQVFKVIGSPSVVHSGSRGDRVSGLAADFMSVCSAAPTATWTNKRTGQQIVQRDMSQARSLFFSDRDQLRRDMEKFAKDNGFLQGGRVASDAATLKADVLPTLLDYLSMTMRETHRGRYVYWQFPYYELELGKGPGDTIQVGRLRWITEATTIGDRTLTPGTNLTANRQNITIGQVSIVLAERGLGSGFPSTSQPVAIPEFVTAYSMLNLENSVGRVLGHDYESWEDLSIRSRYAATSRVLYNNRQSVTTNPALLTAGADGTMTENFLNELYAYMSGLQIPTLDDGCYVLVLNDKALAQLKNSMRVLNRYLDQASLEELTMMFQAMSNREQGKVSGYAGTACGFHIFATNAHSMGAAGTEGVRNETLGAGSTLTRSSYAFGVMAVARAQGMEAEMRTDNVDDFGRLQSFTWLSHETPGYLDVDPAINAEQQLRVVEIRTVDVQL